MATTGANFVNQSATVLSGSAVTTEPFLVAYGPKESSQIGMSTQPVGGSGSLVASSATVVDRVTFDPSLTTVPTVGDPHPVPVAYGTYVGAFAKNGSVLLVLTTTTAQSIDLTNTTTNSPQSTAGDTAFATANVLILNNTGAHDLTISPGASNPSRIPQFTGTTPTLTIPAGSFVAIHSAAGYTVDSTHKVFTITPTSGGTLAVTICGA